MRTITSFSIVVILALTVSGCFEQTASKPAGEGWISLFNGEDLTGWIEPDVEHTWQVVGGVIDYEAKGGNLTSEKEYSDYTLHLDWRFKRTEGGTYNAKIFNPDGSQKTGPDGKPMSVAIANADSGVFVRGSGQSQVNLWMWPCGSGQLWSYHRNEDPKIRKSALPKVHADKPLGQWNTMEITVRGEQVTIVLNGEKVINKAQMAGIGNRGPIVLQHHGGYNENTGKWSPASALIQFRNIWIKEL